MGGDGLSQGYGILWTANGSEKFFKKAKFSTPNFGTSAKLIFSSNVHDSARKKCVSI